VNASLAGVRDAPRRVRLAGLAVLAALVLPFAASPADWGAWGLVYSALALAWLDPVSARDRDGGLGVLVVAAAHAALALLNSLAGPLPGAELDAAVFKSHGLDIAMYEPLRVALGTGFIENLLAALHTLLGNSSLIGDAAAAFAFTLASVFFLRLLHLLEVRRYRLWLVLAFGLWPTSLLFGSVTLREPFQLLAFTAMVYCALRPARGSSRLGWLLAAAAAGLALGMFHAAMLVYAAIAVVLLALWPSGRASAYGWRVRTAALAALAAVAAVGVVGWPNLHIRPGDDLFALAQRDVVHSLKTYRAGVASGEPRSAYGVDLEYTSVPAFAGSLGSLYAHYLFAPFPWQISAPRDLLAAAESLLRLVLLVLAVRMLWRGVPPGRRTVALLLLLYAGMTLTWTLGTTNYGQALRHHLLSNWLLLLIAGPALAAGVHGLLRCVVPGRVLE